ncbi:heparinase II/III family protein [Pseudonocardia broussonetiae]|uniref:Heparinase n=1 Tax=Pseudonocardia broussonetiae TaxID=2736640 RepID=A0A6M6JTA0_9PSEU|nr:alginate lyase family protein [Pseudonocardia broussonetiae]QJY50645.1 heparinase [Pseudonocardia broussonetiae]
MGPAEVAGRVVTARRVHQWRREADRSDAVLPRRRFTATLPAGLADLLPLEPAAGLVGTADRLMDGVAEYFGVLRDDMVDPDWSRDPKTGLRSPSDLYAFDVPYRDEQAVGDVKQLWEPSRHQHLTVLAAAYALTGDERYAHRVAEHLASWWAANPPMRGVHWTSGIELGIRLISWAWTRRLLDGWPGAPALFEHNPEALHQIRFHQRWLEAFPSRGTSANNHVVAELAGQVVASCAFGWFPESGRWGRAAMQSLEVHLARNTFPSGLNREQASEYHGLVLELGIAAVVEADAAGLPVPGPVWATLSRMSDALAAVVDASGRPPRQGDGDDGRGLVLDGDGTDRWASLLSTGAALFGALPWWPTPLGDDLATPLLTALAHPRPPLTGRPATRPHHFADAGLTLLRAPACGSAAELWCRCDGGPHGFGAIAAHAHADALSVEVRHGGVDVLADPGTYCYHGEPEWRAWFRSTLGHNTLELHGTDQSRSGGPFLWMRHARSRVLLAEDRPDGTSRWRAEHDGYAARGRPVVHRRTVELDAAARELRIHDEVRGPGRQPCRLALHLGPAVTAELAGHRVLLSWTGGPSHDGLLELPGELTWTAHRGETDPPRGWYSPGFGRREPAVTLIGSGEVGPSGLATVLCFADVPRPERTHP